MENFDFISDDKLRLMLERDYNELKKCFNNQCYKSVLILSGSLIEAILVEFFLNKLPEGYDENKILKLNLGDLIELALNAGLVDDKVKSLSTIIKNYRNLIHPGRELRLKEQFDSETANVSLSLVKIVLKEIKLKYVEIYGYSAKDLVQKISNDTVSIGIFEELVKKLNYSERLKLLNELVEIELSKTFHEIENPKHYVDILKNLINKEDLIEQLLFLHKKVETGEQWEVLTLLNLFKEDLNLLDKEKKELILKYAISVLSKTKSVRELDKLRERRLFVTIPKYIETSSLLGEYKEMLCYFYWGQETDEAISYLYNQLITGLPKELKEKFENEFQASKPLFQRTRFKIDNTLPF